MSYRSALVYSKGAEEEVIERESRWQRWTNDSHLGRVNLNREVTSITWACGQACAAFPGLKMNVGGAIPLWEGPPQGG